MSCEHPRNYHNAAGCGIEECGCIDEDCNGGEDSSEHDFDCGMDRNGNCGKAGSEECDFECPYRNVKRN